MSNTSGWILLAYRIPSEPTRWRAGVWRRLKGAGAIYLHNSVAILPASPAAERLMRSLRSEIVEQMNGSAQVMGATALAGESDIVTAFNTARDDEYAEIVGRCDDFLTEIISETAAEHFTYGELEENDEDLNKLRGWFEKVAARDTFNAPGAQPARDALDACAQSLDEFANRVYQVDQPISD